MINKIVSLIKWVNSHRILTLAIVWIICGFVFIIIYIALFGIRAVGWQVLTGFATWVLAGGIFLAFSQIRESRRSTNAQIAVELFRMLRSKKSKDTLRLIYELRPQDVKSLSESISTISTNIGIKNLKDRIDSLLDKYEVLGSLVNHDIIDKSLAIEAYGGAPALRCWYKLSGYIKKETSKRGYFLPNYEAFTRHSLDYFNKRDITINFEKSEDGSIVNLTDLLKLDISYRPRSSGEIKRDREKVAKEGVSSKANSPSNK